MTKLSKAPDKQAHGLTPNQKGRVKRRIADLGTHSDEIIRFIFKGIFIVSLLVPLANEVSAQPTVFQDGTFLNADWRFSVYKTSNIQNQASGFGTADGYGNPTFYRRISHAHGGIPTPSDVVSVHIRPSARYTPSLQGAIGSIDYAEDVRTVITEYGTYGAATRMAVRQNGIDYVSANAASTRDNEFGQLPSPYKTIRFNGLTASSFGRVTGPGQFDFSQHPDFSVTGAAIELGFARHSTHTDTSLQTRSTAIDNWSVTIHPAVVVPSIILQPTNRQVAVGGVVQFSVTASGTGPLSYQWWYQGIQIPRANSSTLILTNVQMSQAGSYQAIVSNSTGSVSSQVAQLTVLTPPSIQTHPLDQTINQGDPVTLCVTASGSSPLNFQWYHTLVPITGATNSCYHVSSAQASHAGDYHVDVINSVGSTISQSAFVTVTTVRPPRILLQPSDQNAMAGVGVTLAVTADGTLPIYYQWFRYSTPVSGANAALLTLNNVQPGDSGDYTVQVSNASGSITSQIATLTVTLPSTAHRTLPAEYLPGTSFVVTIDVHPHQQVFAYAVEDYVPSGWAVSDISHFGTLDTINHAVKWGPYFGSQQRSLTYRLTPPAQATGSVSFQGTASFDGISAPIAGNSRMIQSSPPPRIWITTDAQGILIHFTGSLLWEADQPQGPFQPLFGVTSPYRVPMNSPMKFYKTSR